MEKDVHEFFERSMKHFGKEKCVEMLAKDNSPAEFKALIQKEIDQAWR